MILTLELPLDLEAGLLESAQAEGLPPILFVQKLLREQIPVYPAEAMTPAQRAAAWREAVVGLPITPPLSDQAISRETIYRDRV